MMDEAFFRNIEYVLKHRIPHEEKVSEVRLVWYCKTIQNKKALAITIPIEHKFYEITYNGDTDEMYVDIYEKKAKQTFTGEELAQARKAIYAPFRVYKDGSLIGELQKDRQVENTIDTVLVALAKKKAETEKK